MISDHRFVVVHYGGNDYVFATQAEARSFFEEKGLEQVFIFNHYMTVDPPNRRKAVWSDSAKVTWDRGW